MLQNNKRFCLLLLGFCLLAIVFQAMGFFTRAWMRMGSSNVDIDVGLWTVVACVEGEENNACEDFSFELMAEKIMTSGSSDEAAKVAADYYLSEMVKARALTTIAGLAAIFGLVAAIVLCVNPARFFVSVRIRRLVCCLAWLTSSVFLLVAVVCAGQFNATLTMGAEVQNKRGITPEFETRFAWSILLSGFGVFFSAACSSLVAYLMCFDKSSGENGATDEETAEQMAKFQPSRTIFG